MPTLTQIIKRWLSDIRLFSRIVVRRPLHDYQLAPAKAIVDSVIHKKGLEFAILFPRQSGKNETQAQVEAYLLNLFQRVPQAQIVKASPSFNPQTRNSIRRITTTLDNPWNSGDWKTEAGYIVKLGNASILFFSADPAANVVGATASLLLECDEAQDVPPNVWGHKFEPMAASTNATVAYWGTAWTSNTLLAETIKRLHMQELMDGIRRVFTVTPEQVAKENPAFGEFVKRQVAKYGRQHPFVRTQFFNETIDAEGGMFPPARRALMQGQHPRSRVPIAGRIYAAALDVAGEDEGAIAGDTIAQLANPRRDSTALTIFELDLATLADPLIKAPTYRVADRRTWIGVPHSALYGELKAIADLWQVRYLVVDATGVGAGLASFLSKALPDRVLQFEFNSTTKSDLGWNFLAVCDTGRFKDYLPQQGDAQRTTFDAQVEACQYEIIPGPARRMKWAVPDGTRDPMGELVHDDLLLSAALVAALDEQPWQVTSAPAIIRRPDPLKEIDKEPW